MTTDHSQTKLQAYNVATMITQARQLFLAQAKYSQRISAYVRCVSLQDSKGETYRFFGIQVDDQPKANFRKVKCGILKALDFSSTTRCVQVIGDSAPYGKKTSEHAQRFLNQQLAQESGSVVLYGFTGYNDKDKGADINHLVARWIAEKPERAKRVLANVVDFHTVKAIETWGCAVSPYVRNFCLVYSKGDRPSVRFGDDTLFSDGIAVDRLIAIDGGTQAFRQIISSLAHNTPVSGLHSVRNRGDGAETSSSAPLFSATEFIGQLSKRKTLPIIKGHYLTSHTLFSPHKPDAGTKKALFERAWRQLVSEQVWKKAEKLVTIKSYNKAYSDL